MSLLLFVTLFVLVLAAREWFVRHRLGTMECLWRIQAGWFSVDLRRKSLLVRFENDLQEYPLPREVRALTLRVADLPLWTTRCIVSLPFESDARIDRVCANEFDHLFSRTFRLECAAPSLRSVLKT